MVWVLWEGTVASLTALEALATALSKRVQPQDVIFLEGNLGAGKTAFARAFIQACDPSAREVPSPTFTLLQTYDTPLYSIWHFDLYRLKSVDEIQELGMEEGFQNAVSLIEWPERLAGVRTPEPLHLEISFKDETSCEDRIVRILGGQSWVDRLRAFDVTR